MPSRTRKHARRLLTVVAVATAATVAAALGPSLAADAADGAPTISSSVSSFVTTNGDILAENVLTVNGAQALAIGGHFSSIITRTGSTRAASNFAVIRESDGSVLYAASSTGSAGYVRAITSANGVLYVGGDFTSFAGSSRSHVAAIQTSTWQVTSWAPSIGATVRALAASSTTVYVGGNAGTIGAYQQGATATRVWSQSVSGGQVKALLVDTATNGLFVGGYFDTIAGFTNHGLIEVNLATGTPITSFKPTFLPNNQPGADPTYNGENPFSLSLVAVGGATDLAVSTGGIHNYIRLLTTTTGAFVWSYGTVGDGQAVTTVGSSIVVGYHRWRPNTGRAWPYFAAQLTTSGALTSWNGHLSGTQTLADNGGNGTMALAYDGTTHMLFVGGAFTTYDATCNVATTASCSGGKHLQSLAAYSVTP